MIASLTLPSRCVALAAVLSFLAHVPTVAQAAGAAAPNVVFILIDDLRHDTFSHAGHPFIETPHLDRLASEGLRFTNAFVTASLCSPSRASFLTGQYMHHHRVVDNNDRMPAETVTFPQLLQQADYETAFIGKWHMGGSSDAPRPGFDHWVSFRGQGTYAPQGQTLNVNGRQVPRQTYMTDELTQYAADWLATRDRETPFLLYLSHKGVHGLYDPAPRHRDRYRDVEFPAPASLTDTLRDAAGKPMWVRDQRNSWHGVEFPYYGRSGQTIAEMYRHYCEMILSVDDSVGRVMEVLQQKGLAHNTLVIFTSDGGHLWGEHGLIDKRCAYEPSMRIPFLARWPAVIEPGTTSDALIANIDVAPTLLDLAELDVPHSMDGRSLAPVLQGPVADSGKIETPEDWRKALLYEYYWEPNFPQTPTTFALRDDRFKFIQYHGVWDTDELYDLVEDPGERHNLIHVPAMQKQVTAYRKRLYDTLRETGGLAIPLGFKRNHGANLRHAEGTSRAEFPPAMLHPETRPHAGKD